VTEVRQRAGATNLAIFRAARLLAVADSGLAVAEM